jgi:gliding motility-associated-like protein
MTSKRFSSLIFIITILFFSTRSFASHMIGGDVTYRCVGNNNFEITITLFQDCLYGEPGALAQDNPANYSIFDAVTNQYITGDSVYALSTEIVPPNFSNACINNYPNTCMRKQVFRFTRTLQPNPNGYMIVYERCCRNASISNIQTPGNVGVTYFARIPGFTNGQCPNSSAVFVNLPPQIICANNPLVYDFSAVDPDGDSLSYRLCAARPGGSTSDAKPFGPNMTMPVAPSVNYMPPASATVPMSGVPPLQINAVTGLMTGTPNAIGRYVVTICVTEWKNGVAVNTVSRDIQFVVTNCSKAVVANIPELPDEPNTYTVQCKGYKVNFINNSTGGFSYHWDFGVPGATSTDFEPSFTYPDTGTYVVTLIVNKGSTCPDSISRLVKVYPEFHGDFNWTGKLCPEEPIHFHDLSTATYLPINSWRWSFGDGTNSTEQNPVHIYPRPGGAKQVTLISKSALGCRDTVTKTLPLPVFDPYAGNDTIVVLGYLYTLNGTGSQYFQWSPPDYLSNPNIHNPLVTFPDTGRYTYVLTGSSEEGCVAKDSITIWVVSYGQLFVPNAFSPNGDGVNDVLMPRIVGYKQINFFHIFNRYGQKVYTSTNDNYPGWDGKQGGQMAELGVYYWVINVTDKDGNKVVQKGDVTLLR